MQTLLSHLSHRFLVADISIEPFGTTLYPQAEAEMYEDPVQQDININLSAKIVLTMYNQSSI